MDKISALDRKIIIKQPVVTVADSGQERKTFSVFRTTFAQVTERFGNEAAQAGEVVAQTVVDFIVRYREGLAHNMIIEYRDTLYNIQSITEADYKGQFYRDRFTKITALKTDNNITQQF